MPVNLEKPADLVDIASAEYATMLQNMQANILWAHGRNFARHFFVRFTAAPAAVKSWIRDTAAKKVTTAADQLEQSELRLAKPGFDGGPVHGFFLSAKGYEFLQFDTECFASGSFRKGMKDRDEGILGGVVRRILDTDNKDPEPGTWEPGFQQEIHALLTVADTHKPQVEVAAAAIRESLVGIADVLTVEEGTVLRRANAANRKRSRPRQWKIGGDLQGEPIFHWRGPMPGLDPPTTGFSVLTGRSEWDRL